MAENLEQMRQNFETAVADYVAALLEQFDWVATYGYWVADDCTGIYCYGDEYFINLSDIVYIVDHGVTFETFATWYEYSNNAHEFGLTHINLQSWCMGCPHASEEEIEHLRKLKQDFFDAVKECKDKY